MALIATAKYPTAIATEADCGNQVNWVPSVVTNVSLGADITTLVAITPVLATGTGAKLPLDNFFISIDDEIMFVTSRATDTLTIALAGRGAEGTTAATHANTTAVYHRITAKQHNQLVSEVFATQTALGVNLANVVKTSAVGATSGVASLDGTGKVPTAQLPTAGTGTEKPYGAINTTAVTRNGAVTTDQILMTQVITAADWDVAGRAFRLRCGGVLTGQASATTITMKIAIAGVVTALSFAAQTITSLSGVPWFLDCTIIRTTTGTTGKTSAWGTFSVNNLSVAGHTLNATWDGTVSQTIEPVVDMSTASATNSITNEFMTIEQITA